MEALVYDPRYHTFVSWASLMCEQYAAQQLSIPDNKTDWREWGDGLFTIGIFATEGTPRPSEFENWDDWASAMLAAVNPTAS